MHPKRISFSRPKTVLVPCRKTVFPQVTKINEKISTWNPQPTYTFHLKCILPHVISSKVWSAPFATVTSAADSEVMDILQELHETNQLEVLEKAFEFIEKENPSMCAEYYDFIMFAFLKRKYFALVFKYYRHMQERKIQPTDRTYRTLMIAYGYARLVKRVEYYWNFLSFLDDHEIWEEAVTAFGNCGHIEKSVALLERMEELRLPLREELFNRLFDAMIKNNKFDMFPAVYKKMQQADPVVSPATLHVFMKIHGKREEISKVVSLFEQIRSEFPGELQVRDYTVVIQSLTAAGKDKMALRYYEDFKRSGLQPVDQFYAVALELLLKLGKQDEINRITNHIITSDEFTMDAVKPLLVSLSAEGDVTRMQAVFKGVKATPRGYNLLLSALGKYGNLDGMMSLFNQIKEQPHYASRFVYTTVITYLGKRGRLNEAISVFEEFQATSFNVADTAMWNAILTATTTARRYDLFDKYLAEMKAKMVPMDVWTNITILNVKCERGEVSAVKEYIRATTGAGETPSLVQLNILLKATAQQSVDRMLDIFEFMKRKLESLNVVVYHTVIHAVIKAGRWELAELLFKEAEESCEVDASLYNMMIHSLYESEHKDKIRYYLSRMEENDIKWNKATLGMMLKITSEHEGVDMMQKLVDDHPDIKLDNISLAYFIIACGKAKRIDDMIHYFEETRKAGGATPADYAYVIYTLFYAKRYQQAVAYGEDMLARGIFSMKALDFTVQSLMQLDRIRELPHYLRLLEKRPEKPYATLCTLLIAHFLKHDDMVDDCLAAMRYKLRYFFMTDMEYLAGINAILRCKPTSPDTLPTVLELLSSIKPATTKPATIRAVQHAIIQFIKSGSHKEYVKPFFDALQKAGLQPVPAAEELHDVQNKDN